MSQYQYPHGYGQYHNQPPQNPYGYQSPPAYPAHGYNPSYNGPAAEANIGALQSSFDFTATQIPGLGSAVGAADGNPFPASGNVWALQPPLLAPLPPTVTALSPPNIAAASHSGRSLPPVVKTTESAKITKPPTPSAAPIVNNSNDVDMEEGELSEGQFEDLYENPESVREPPQPASSKGIARANPSLPESAADTPNAFYGDEEEGEVRPGDAQDSASDRSRSASYSPCLSLREIQTDTLALQNTLGPVQSNPSPPFLSADAPREPLCEVQATSKPPSTTSDPSPLPAFRSFQEARKEAQKAILRLWPLGVKYQNYIDEGFDEKVIKGLFGDLHLEMAHVKPAAAAAPSEAPSSAGEQSATPKSGCSVDAQHPVPTPDSAEPTAAGTKLSKSEERKDRIARLLAAKAAKPAPAPPAAQEPATTQTAGTQSQAQEANSTTPTTLPPKQKVHGEKERLLKLKIAALQKSREAMAQKAAAAKSAPTAQGDSLEAASKAQNDHSGSSPRDSIGTPASETTSNPSRSSSAVPGLLLQALAQPPQTAHRKRPTAADFVDYSSTAPAKRFRQVHQEDSLIIDVSEDSDDEEMDMDLGSPIDEPSVAPAKDNSITRGPSVRDFPPLTDTLPQRKLSSRASSRTPPVGPASVKHRELDIKQREIEEMRRKIALAEARRKAKMSAGGSRTPTLAVQGSEDKDADPSRERLGSTASSDLVDAPSGQSLSEAVSAKLAKPSEVAQAGRPEKAERRVRIVSLDLPRIDGTVEEKKARLLRLQEEAARLQAEIDQSLAEKKLLTEELKQLDDSPVAESPALNGLDSAHDTHASVVEARASSPAAPEKAASATPAPSASEQQTPVAAAVNSPPSSSESRSEADAVLPEPQPDSSGDVVMGGVDEEDGDTNTSGPATGPGLESSSESGADNEPSDPAEAPCPLDDPSTREDAHPSPTSPRQNGHADDAIDAETSEGELPEPDETTPMELDSRSPSFEAADTPIIHVTEDSIDNAVGTSAPMPSEPSGTLPPREDAQEMEPRSAPQEQHGGEPNQEPKLMPYESPLRFFRAYRFHPKFRDTVPGGLKSLTYSNCIDPRKEFCPFELAGEPCPDACSFQHFRSIAAPDGQILLELGSAEQFSGEQKKRFVQGLRELLNEVKTNQVNDFDAIAQRIIDFRSRFLGDKSKLLPLEGVTI